MKIEEVASLSDAAAWKMLFPPDLPYGSRSTHKNWKQWHAPKAPLAIDKFVASFIQYKPKRRDAAALRSPQELAAPPLWKHPPERARFEIGQRRPLEKLRKFKTPQNRTLGQKYRASEKKRVERTNWVQAGPRRVQSLIEKYSPLGRFRGSHHPAGEHDQEYRWRRERYCNPTFSSGVGRGNGLLSGSQYKGIFGRQVKRSSSHFESRLGIEPRTGLKPSRQNQPCEAPSPDQYINPLIPRGQLISNTDATWARPEARLRPRRPIGWRVSSLIDHAIPETRCTAKGMSASKPAFEAHADSHQDDLSTNAQKMKDWLDALIAPNTAETSATHAIGI